MSAAQLRKFIKIVEGELIPQRQHTLRINVDDYHLLRAMLHLPNGSQYVPPNQYGSMKIMTFWDSLSYVAVKAKLAQFGIPYIEEPDGMTTYFDKELDPRTEHVQSPYPSNKNVRKPDEEAAPAELPRRAPVHYINIGPEQTTTTHRPQHETKHRVQHPDHPKVS